MSIHLKLELEFDATSPESQAYLLDANGIDPQIGFLLDFFDLFAYHTDTSLISINNESFEQIKARFDSKIAAEGL